MALTHNLGAAAGAAPWKSHESVTKAAKAYGKKLHDYKAYKFSLEVSLCNAFQLRTNQLGKANLEHWLRNSSSKLSLEVELRNLAWELYLRNLA